MASFVKEHDRPTKVESSGNSPTERSEFSLVHDSIIVEDDVRSDDTSESSYGYSSDEEEEEEPWELVAPPPCPGVKGKGKGKGTDCTRQVVVDDDEEEKEEDLWDLLDDAQTGGVSEKMPGGDDGKCGGVPAISADDLAKMIKKLELAEIVKKLKNQKAADAETENRFVMSTPEDRFILPHSQASLDPDEHLKQLQQLKLAKRREAQNNRQLALAQMRNGGVGVKAIASQYQHKQKEAHNEATAAIRHHWGAGGGGSHYHLAGSVQFQKGLRLKGVVSRHSHQAAVRNGKKSKAKSKKSGSTLGMLGDT